MTLQGKHYSSLDGFRFYASIGIIAMHVLANCEIRELPNNYIFNTLIPWFTDFTLLFMILSGFSLSCGYFERISTGSITPYIFYLRRIKRILPFFALMAFAETIITPSAKSFIELYADLTLCFGLIPEANIQIIGVGWFIGVVMVYYMLFPFVVALQHSNWSSWLSFIAISILVFMGCHYSFNPAIDQPLLSRSDILFCLPLFMGGGIIYRYRQQLETSSNAHSYMWSVICLAVTILFFIFPIYTFSQSLRLAADGILFSLWIIVALGINPSWLSGKYIRHLSSISLEIYLCHMPSFRLLQKLGVTDWVHNSTISYIITFITTTLLAITVAYIGKYHIIAPMFSHIQNFTNKKKNI